MCPPVDVHPIREGMSYLYASWLYELQHGCQLRVCFTCFKIAFLDFKATLESEDLEVEDWESMELDEDVSEDEDPSGLGPVLGPQEEDPGPPMVPTQPISLDLCPKNEDWIQALPWRFPGLPRCPHWPRPPPPPQVFPGVTMALVEPMVLELGTMWPMDPWEAEAWLLGLQFFLVVGGKDNTILMRRFIPVQALRSMEQRWRVLLEPTSGVWMSKLYEPALLPDLFQDPLGILERPQHDHHIFSAFMVLQRNGFIILSFSPWSARAGGEGHSASAPWPVT